MNILLIIAGVLLILLGIVIYRKLPGIKEKTVRRILLSGTVVLLIGILFSFYTPPKGLLMSGSTSDTGNDDASGLENGRSGDDEADDSIVVEGDSILLKDRVFHSPEEFREYLKENGRDDGYRIMDRYAVYDVYTGVIRVLEEEKIPVISEETLE